MLVAAQINGTNFKTSKPISKSVANGIDFGFAIILQMLLFLLLLLLLLMSIHMISMDAKAKISSLMQLIFWTHFMLKLRNKWCLKNRNVKVKMKMKICNRLQSLWRVNTFPKVWHNDYFTTYVFGIDLFWVLANPNYSSHGISIRLDEITSSIVASLCRRSRVVQSMPLIYSSIENLRKDQTKTYHLISCLSNAWNLIQIQAHTHSLLYEM